MKVDAKEAFVDEMTQAVCDLFDKTADISVYFTNRQLTKYSSKPSPFRNVGGENLLIIAANIKNLLTGSLLILMFNYVITRPRIRNSFAPKIRVMSLAVQ